MQLSTWIAFTLMLAPCVAQADHEWPQYRGNAGTSGVSTDDSVKPPLKLLWSYRLDGDASGDAGAGVTVAGGKVFVNVANTKSIVVLNAHTGRFEWEYKESYVGYRTVPSYSGGRLYLWERSTKKHAVLALDAANGKVLWKQETGALHSDTDRVGLPVTDGKVFCSEGGEDPAVLAFDEKTGERVFRASLGKEDGPAVTCPTVAGGRVFAGLLASHGFRASKDGAVVALDATSGKELWRRKGLFPNRSLTTDGKIVVCTMYAKEDTKSYLLDAETGKTLWVGPARFHYNPATITKDLVLIRPYGASCYGLERDTGKQRWSFDVKGVASGCCSPAVSGDYAYFGTGVVNPGDLEGLSAFQHVTAPRERGISGTMHAVDLRTGKSVWHFGTANCVCGDPAIAYGRLYFTSRDGMTYCFAPAKAGEPTVPEAKDTSPAVAPEAVAGLLAKPTGTPRPGLDWPMAGGSPHRAGREDVTLKTPLDLAWKYDMGDCIVSEPAIRDGRVFVGADAGKIAAIDLKTGVKAWEFVAGAKVRCAPAVVGGFAYCGADDGRFHALAIADGKPRWTFEASGPVRASPAVRGDVLVFGANDHHVYALDRTNGKTLWRTRLNDYALQAAPVLHGEHVYVAQWNDWVWALDLKTGKTVWKSFVPVSIEMLALHRDKLYVRNPNWIVELDPKTGKRLRIGYASWGWGGLAFLKNRMFVSGIQSQYGTNGATVTDLDEEGTLFKTPIPTLEDVRLIKGKGIKSAPLYASMATPLALGDRVCFASTSGVVTIAEPDGTKLWTYTLGGTCHATPIAADGMLVVGCDDGFLYAFRQAEK